MVTSTAQIEPIYQAIKFQMKKNKIKYVTLAQKLKISVPTVKRMLTKGPLSLERLINICEVIGLTFYELAEIAKADSEEPQLAMSKEQESFLLVNSDFAEYLIQIVNGYQPNEIRDMFGITEAQSQHYLCQLEKKHLIFCSSVGTYRATKEVLRGPSPNGELDLDFKQRSAKILLPLVEKELQRDYSNSPKQSNDSNVAVAGYNLSSASRKNLKEDLKELLKRYSAIERQEARTMQPKQLKSCTFVCCLFDINIYTEAYRSSIKKQ